METTTTLQMVRSQVVGSNGKRNTYKPPSRKTHESTSLYCRSICSVQIIGSGKMRMMVFNIIFGMPEPRKKALMLMQCPGEKSHSDCTGRHSTMTLVSIAMNQAVTSPVVIHNTILKERSLKMRE